MTFNHLSQQEFQHLLDEYQSYVKFCVLQNKKDTNHVIPYSLEEFAFLTLPTDQTNTLLIEVSKEKELMLV